MVGNGSRHYDLNPNLFATDMSPRFDPIPFALLHPAFAEFDNAEIMPEDEDVQLVKGLQTGMNRNFNTERNQCEEFWGILTKYYKEIAWSPTGTARSSDGRVDQNGLLLTVLQGELEKGRAQVQGSMYSLEALREKLEKLNLLNRPFPFPCMIIILTGTRCCLFWKQELTSAPSQETAWDFVAQSSRRASNLKYLPPAFLSTPIF